jgi:hypothetical protein
MPESARHIKLLHLWLTGRWYSYRRLGLNAICERFRGSVRRECPDYFLLLSQRHLHRVMKEYQEYFNHARPYQGIGQCVPCQPVRGAKPQTIGEIISRPVLGDLHHDYHRQSHERSPYARAA